MTTKPHFCREVATFAILLACLILSNNVLAKPRPPGPPWPEMGLLFRESFDQPYVMSSNATIDATVWAEGWSGYCLNRVTPSVSPWSIPILGSNTSWNIDPIQGAVRFWYKPEFGGGIGPGSLARLLTLVSTNGISPVTLWSLAISADGSQITCQKGSGPSASLSAPVAFQAGVWYLITLGYSETNSALFIDEQQVAVGDGFPGIAPQDVPSTSLILGSSPEGRDVAEGQIDELSTFTGSARFLRSDADTFGLTVNWEILAYYGNYSQVALLGPITEAEEAAQRALAIQLRAQQLEQQLADQQGGASGSLTTTSPDSGMSPLGPGPLPPGGAAPPPVLRISITGSNLFLINITNGVSTTNYALYSRLVLNDPAYSWTLVTNGPTGVTNFPVNGGADFQSFYRAILGTDTDGDGVPDWEDADPLNPGVGILTISITSPAQGSAIQ